MGSGAPIRGHSRIPRSYARNASSATGYGEPTAAFSCSYTALAVVSLRGARPDRDASGSPPGRTRPPPQHRVTIARRRPSSHDPARRPAIPPTSRLPTAPDRSGHRSPGIARWARRHGFAGPRRNSVGKQACERQFGHQERLRRKENIPFLLSCDAAPIQRTMDIPEYPDVDFSKLYPVIQSMSRYPITRLY